MKTFKQYINENLGSNNIGLPGMYNTKKKYKIDNIDGYKIKSVNKGYHGSHAGWNIEIDGQKYFNNNLQREVAIKKVLERHKLKYAK